MIKKYKYYTIILIGLIIMIINIHNADSFAKYIYWWAGIFIAYLGVILELGKDI